MPTISHTAENLIGNTPLQELRVIPQSLGCPATVAMKLEYFNPGSSIKDRLAKALLDDAETRGLLRPHAATPGLIVESTSGNTGIGLAFMAALRGYRLILTMPESMSAERKNLLRGLGAELVLTPAAGGMEEALAEAERILAANPGAFMPDQFRNMAGREAHYRTTGPEIWQACGGKIDIFVSAFGTGGTISGAGRYLKEMNPGLKVYAVEPAESPLLSAGRAAAHQIQGIGANFIPPVLDQSVLDGVMTVPGADAIKMARRLMREEGIFCGISSGANAMAALELAARPENAKKRIVTIACDTAERYLSTALFAE